MIQFILLSLSFVEIIKAAFALQTCNTLSNATLCKMAENCEVSAYGTPINFGFSDLNRLKLVITTKMYEIELTWSIYANNGYIYVMTLAPEQFGIISINNFKDDGTTQTTTDVPVNIKYTWVNTVTTYTAVYTQTFNKLFSAAYAPAANTAVPVTCVYDITTITTCPTFPVPVASIDQLMIFHHDTIKDCPTITSTNQPYFRLAKCV